MLNIMAKFVDKEFWFSNSNDLCIKSRGMVSLPDIQ